jgi:hypothetical protein
MVALRGDMDALPVQEPDELAFRSKVHPPHVLPNVSGRSQGFVPDGRTVTEEAWVAHAGAHPEPH